MAVAAVREPDLVFAVHDDELRLLPLLRDPSDPRWTAAGAEVEVRADGDGAARIHVSGAGRALSRVVLRWRRAVSSATLVLGDAWERSYGDLQWRHLEPERLLPWYWLGHDPEAGTTVGMGVAVRAGALCSWTVDSDGVSLWLDVRNGGGGVDLGARVLDAATVHAVEAGRETSPWEAATELCGQLCHDPVPSEGPVVGSNNWYYAYGQNFDNAAVLRDAETIVELADGHAVRPYSVIDAGWTEGGSAPGGPWDVGLPGVFDDMAGTASQIKKRGARPGLWFRPLLSRVQDGRARGGPPVGGGWALDPTLDETLESISADIRRFVEWGYELIKHDFSTFDLFGRFGPRMGSEITTDGWHLARRDVTNAEAVVGFYRTIKAAAADAARIISCNVIGHLAAGLTDIQRTGDDTSGRQWERTRRMGVNTLAFRLPQHRRFFTLDADCVPCTTRTDWDLNRRFLDVVARSGTALFVSVDPAARTPSIDADLRRGVQLALDGGDPGGIEPLDWLRTTAPQSWRSERGVSRYDWGEPWGALPYPAERL